MHEALRGSLRLFSLIAFTFLLLISGCRSPYVETTIVNSGSTELRNVEVDYPSASFGISRLAPGETFQYRFKIRDSGRMKVEFFDSAEKAHSGTGPYVAEPQQGVLILALDGSGKNVWNANLHPPVQTPKGK